jgi:hypothetical protein
VVQSNEAEICFAFQRASPTATFTAAIHDDRLTSTPAGRLKDFDAETFATTIRANSDNSTNAVAANSKNWPDRKHVPLQISTPHGRYSAARAPFNRT